MKLKKLEKRAGVEDNKKLNKAYSQLSKIIDEINKLDLSADMINIINSDIEEANLSTEPDRKLRKRFAKIQSKIFSLIEKELKLVPKNYYLTFGLIFGITAIGTFFGILFGAIFENMAFMGLGLPVGMPIGLAIGALMDRKAFKEGRQLDIDM